MKQHLVSASCVAASMAVLLASGNALGQGSDSISIVSPAENQVARPGDVLPVVIKLDGSLTPQRVAIWASFSVGELEDFVVPFPYEAEIEIPETFYGTAALNVLVTPSLDDFVPAAKKTMLFKVQPDVPVMRVVAEDDSIHLDVPPAPASSRRVTAYTALSTGQTVSVDRAGINVTFSVDDPAVATVSPDGTVSALAPGQAWLTVQHENWRDWVEVVVEDRAAEIGPAAVDVSMDVAITSNGFRVDPQNGHIVEEVFVANISQEPLHRPYSLVVEGLPEGVVLLSPAGRTRRTAPIGTPYELITLADNPEHFMPGAVARVELRYLNPAGMFINHQLRVITGARP